MPAPSLAATVGSLCPSPEVHRRCGCEAWFEDMMHRLLRSRRWLPGREATRSPISVAAARRHPSLCAEISSDAGGWESICDGRRDALASRVAGAVSARRSLGMTSLMVQPDDLAIVVID